MKITIREGTMADVPALVEVGARIWLETYLPDEAKGFGLEQLFASGEAELVELAGYVSDYFTRENIAGIMHGSGYFALMEIDSVLAGFALLTRSEPEKCIELTNVLEVDKFYVDSRWHGKGVASSLMEYIKKYCREQGHEALWLSVYHRNSRAIGFYEKQRFADVGECYFIIGENRHLNRVMLWTVN